MSKVDPEKAAANAAMIMSDFKNIGEVYSQWSGAFSPQRPAAGASSYSRVRRVEYEKE
jgi:hypothetical protein